MWATRFLFLFSAFLILPIDANAAFNLHTGSFTPQASIPILYTCDGKDISPEFDWQNMPDKTESFAFIMHDVDAPGGDFYHWVLYNIPKRILSFPEGMKEIPTSVLVGKNSWNVSEYKGPCPPQGKAHRYIFTIYALDADLRLAPGQTAEAIKKAIKSHILGQAQLSATYERK